MSEKRTKACYHCEARPEALFRCQYGDDKDWRFLCEACLLQVKARDPSSYRYGGTWKRSKK
jgi:hypothetical protein